MCAGVQNVSRPMERCQEISQCVPTMAEVTAMTEHHTYQGIAGRTGVTGEHEEACAGHISLRYPNYTLAALTKVPPKTENPVVARNTVFYEPEYLSVKLRNNDIHIRACDWRCYCFSGLAMP